MLRLDRDGDTGIFVEQAVHAVAQRFQVVHFHARLLRQRRQIGRAAAKAPPGQIVEEEIRAGGIRQARPDEIIGLDVVDVGPVADDAQALAGLAHRVVQRLGGFQRLGRQLVNIVNFARDQPHRLAIAGVAHGLPSRPDSGSGHAHGGTGAAEPRPDERRNENPPEVETRGCGRAGMWLRCSGAQATARWREAGPRQAGTCRDDEGQTRSSINPERGVEGARAAISRVERLKIPGRPTSLCADMIGGRANPNQCGFGWHFKQSPPT